MDKENIKVLVLANHYQSFIREEINHMSNLVDNVNVLIRYNILTEFSSLFKFSKYYNYLQPYTKRNLINWSNPNNVSVSLLPMLYFVPDGKNKIIEEKIFNKAIQIIERNNIKFDIIHAHFALPYGYAGMLLKKKYRCPLVVTCRGDDVRIPLVSASRYPKTSMTINKLNSVISESDSIITYHEELRDLLLKNYSEKINNKLTFFYKGVNLDHFQPNSLTILRNTDTIRSNLGINNRFVVLFLASIIREKGPECFARAAAICKDMEDIVWVMVGEGILKKDIEKYKQKESLDNLILVGYQQNTAVWYSIANVFCALATIENIWATTLEEAFCMGKPSVVSQVGYVDKILKNQIDAYFVPPNDPQALATAIIHIKNNPLLKDTLTGKTSYWRELFDMRNTTQKIVSKYMSVLK